MRFESTEAVAAYFARNPQLTHIVISNGSGLENVELLPSAFAHLRENGPHLTSLPALPSTLTYLEIYDCSGLTSLPELPTGLTNLGVCNCLGLRSLPVLPNTLTELAVCDCPELTSLPELPVALIELFVSNCSGLTRPELPSGLTSLTWRPSETAGSEKSATSK